MKVEIRKTYRTKGGHDVVIYAIYPEQKYAVHGAFCEEGKWSHLTWRLNGAWAGLETDMDLIEVRPERVVWINEYADGKHGDCYDTKKKADSWASAHMEISPRIRLHRVALNDDTEWKGGGDD